MFPHIVKRERQIRQWKKKSGNRTRETRRSNTQKMNSTEERSLNADHKVKALKKLQRSIEAPTSMVKRRSLVRIWRIRLLKKPLEIRVSLRSTIIPSLVRLKRIMTKESIK